MNPEDARLLELLRMTINCGECETTSNVGIMLVFHLNQLKEARELLTLLQKGMK